MSSEIKIALLRARFDELSKQRAEAVEKVIEMERSMDSLINQLIAEGFSDDNADLLLEKSMG